MTKGQALYHGACQAIGIEPAAHGSQKRLLERCDDITNQSALSSWKRGRTNPNSETVRRMEERFKFRLENMGWRAVHRGEG